MPHLTDEMYLRIRPRSQQLYDRVENFNVPIMKQLFHTASLSVVLNMIRLNYM